MLKHLSNANLLYRSHNGMAKDSSLKFANGQSKKPSQAGTNNGAPRYGTHASLES